MNFNITSVMKTPAQESKATCIRLLSKNAATIAMQNPIAAVIGLSVA
jgi:hypothetical protein